MKRSQKTGAEQVVLKRENGASTLLQAQTHDGRSLRILTLIDAPSRAYQPLKVAQRINSLGVIEVLADAMCLHCNHAAAERGQGEMLALFGRALHGSD